MKIFNKINNLIDAIRKVSTEDEFDEDCGTRIMIRNEDGTYTEVTSNDEDD